MNVECTINSNSLFVNAAERALEKKNVERKSPLSPPLTLVWSVPRAILFNFILLSNAFLVPLQHLNIFSLVHN